MGIKKLLVLLVAVYIVRTGFSQWEQVNSPAGTTNVSSFIAYDTLKLISASCGLHTTADLSGAWKLGSTYEIQAYTLKGDSLFIGSDYDGIWLVKLNSSSFNPVRLGYNVYYTKSLDHDDSCLYIGSEFNGVFRYSLDRGVAVQLNEGLPFIENCFETACFNMYFVYSIKIKDGYIFAGTHEGIYRASLDDLRWEDVNSSSTRAEVSFISVIDNMLFMGIGEELFVSEDNGESWQVYYVAPSGITSVYKNGMNIYVSTGENGIQFTEDGGQHWQSLNSGLIDLSVDFISSADSVLVCGTQTSGFYYYFNDQWINNNKGIICSQVRSLENANGSLVFTDGDKVYASDNGNNWSDVTPGVENDYFGSLEAMGDTVFLTYKYYVPNPNFENNVRILYTTNGGETWDETGSPVPYWGDDTYRMYASGKRLYVHEDDKMYYTDNLGADWNNISLPEEYCNYFYSFLVHNSVPYAAACGNAELIKLDESSNWVLSNNGLPSDREIEFMVRCKDAIFAYVFVHGMYASTDNGESWSEANNGINDELNYADYAYRDSELFLASNKGVFYTDDHGQNWYKINTGLINKDLSSIVERSDTLFVGTYGNGIWKRAIDNISYSPSAIIDRIPVKIYPNPVTGFIYVNYKNTESAAEVEIYDITGSLVLSKRINTDDIVNVEKLKSGLYIIKINFKNSTYTDKFIVN